VFLVAITGTETRTVNGLVTVVFWACALALLHTFVLYPLSLVLASFWTDDRSADGSGRTPSVALAVAAYNEREVIERKLENSLALEYPDGKLRIVVVDDGSTDGTDAVVRSYADRGVELLRVEGRVGKTACQNELVEAVDEEVVVFSDADSMYDPDAISRLVERFEPGVGCVVGNLEHREDGLVAGEHVYWRFEQLLKRLEGRVSTAVTGTGAIYAVRRSSYDPLPADAISDFALPLAILADGERVAYAPDAVARERMSGDVEDELRRRLRIATRIWRTGLRRRELFNPVRRPLVAYQLLSHRGLLALAPLSFAGLFVATLASVAANGGPFAHGLLAFKGSFGLLAGVGAVAHTTGRPLPPALEVPYYLTRSGVGMLRGLVNLRDGDGYTTWETLEREPSNAEGPESRSDD
jgi:cellulose synthase/poly-beta-1,6-N-acetylglucosamine synthase-like glycosyltransferase